MRHLSDEDLETQVMLEIGDILLEQPESGYMKLSPVDAYTLIAIAQLAYRQPECQGYSRDLVRALVDTLEQMFEDNQAITESIRRGWIPR